MSSAPTNPLFNIMKNWQRLATEMTGTARTRANTLRATWYSRLYGPTPPAGRVGPLMRLRQSGAGGIQRAAPLAAGRVIPHAARPGVETYDYTYRGPMNVPPFTTQRRLGLEHEPYDFTF